MECAAVDAESHKHGLEACTVYGDPTVCSCRHSKTSSWVRRTCSTVYGDCTVCSCRHSKTSAWVGSRYCMWQMWDYVEKR